MAICHLGNCSPGTPPPPPVGVTARKPLDHLATPLPPSQADTMFKKMWTQANFSEGGGGGGGAEDDDVRGKRNAAVVARQKFEAEPQAKVGAKKVRNPF